MRVVTWNMGLNDGRFRAPGVHDAAWHYLLGLRPDIACLQESRPPEWAFGQGRIVSAAFNRWGSVIFSPRFPLETFRLPQESRLRALGAYVAVGLASLPDGAEVFVASVHARAERATARQLGDVEASAVARTSVGHANVNDLVFAGLRSLVGPRFIAAGDWNTGRTQEKAEAGTEYFRRLETAGWYDAAWEANDHEETRTWYGPRQKSLIQDDHVFCDRELGQQVRSAWAASDAPQRLGLSDHAPLVIDIEMEAIAMTNLRGEATP